MAEHVLDGALTTVALIRAYAGTVPLPARPEHAPLYGRRWA